MLAQCSQMHVQCQRLIPVMRTLLSQIYVYMAPPELVKCIYTEFKRRWVQSQVGLIVVSNGASIDFGDH